MTPYPPVILGDPSSYSPLSVVRSLMAIDGEQAAIRTVIAGFLVEHGSARMGKPLTLFWLSNRAAMVKALELAGYEIKRRK
jgi:hypothetical protein